MTTEPARIARANVAVDVVAAGRKGAKASPWSRIPFNENARRTARLEMIRAAAEGRAVRPMKLRSRP
ncbi:MAG: hypothetical protein KGO96_13995 [Elusimicrobia bacterium]|nr:hypothetical protein [Elusimicrobiota bacterium]